VLATETMYDQMSNGVESNNVYVEHLTCRPRWLRMP
jgi:hypothetical protein